MRAGNRRGRVASVIGIDHDYHGFANSLPDRPAKPKVLVEAEAELERTKDPKLYVVSANALFADALPIQKEIVAAMNEAGSKYRPEQMTEGWIAGMIMKTKMGVLVDIVVGIVGALIGGFLLSFFVDTASGGWWFTLFTATLGAVILLWVLRLVRPRTRV